MKRINYLFLSLLFYTITFSAQNYDPVIKDGSFWDIEKQLGGVCSTANYKYLIGNDTIIEGKTYKKLLFSQFDLASNNNSSPCPIYKSPAVVSFNNFIEIDKYIRENVSEKKVYIWADKEQNGTFKEFTLYDFSLEIGEKMTNSYAENGNDITIVNIDYDDKGKKRFHQENHPFVYTQGIGSSGGIINFDAIIGEGNETLFCYGNTQNQNNCTPVLATEKYNLSKTEIYPNPTANTISLKNVPLDSRIRIVTILGKQIDSFILKQKTIDISNYKKGIYFIEITTSNNSKKLLKLIKK